MKKNRKNWMLKTITDIRVAEEKTGQVRELDNI